MIAQQPANGQAAAQPRSLSSLCPLDYQNRNLAAGPDVGLPVECGGADAAFDQARQTVRPEDRETGKAGGSSSVLRSHGLTVPRANDQWPLIEPEQAEMTEDMANLLRASTPPVPDRPINSVEDLLEVVHELPVVEIFRRMKHLKASRIRRMLDSRKFREHMELRRRLAWEKSTTEAAVTAPAAVDKLYRLTMCDKPETARKSCMALIRLGRKDREPARRSLGEGGTGNRGAVRPALLCEARYAGRSREDRGTGKTSVSPDPAPFRLVPGGAGEDAAGLHNSRQTQGLQQHTPTDVQAAKTTPKAGSDAAKLRQAFMEKLAVRLREA